MSDIAIKVEGLSKQYQIGGAGTSYQTFREALLQAASAPARWLGKGRSEKNTIWALDDISFEVKHGEAVGIIGRNGAGKSTLLKILSRITRPTRGRADLYGRVGSLLEVGTGFHAELTGRENIFLNGAILGMTRQAITRKFDEIVDFSGVEKFLDTPVKRYSSGMYVRLAFAVAAHLEPEILVVDEVLAVGDAAFQKKCLGKMGEVANEGRTVLFVSHNMGAISQLCQTAILIREGKLKVIGATNKVIDSYLASATDKEVERDLSNFLQRKGSGEIEFEWVRLQTANGNSSRNFALGDDLVISFRIKPNKNHINKAVRLSVVLRNSLGANIANMVDEDSGFLLHNLGRAQTINVSLDDIRLYPDTYHISLWAGGFNGKETYDYVADCLNFEVVSDGKLTARRLPTKAGVIFLTPTWEVSRL